MVEHSSPVAISGSTTCAKRSILKGDVWNLERLNIESYRHIESYIVVSTSLSRDGCQQQVCRSALL